MKKQLITTLLLLCTFLTQAQTTPSKFDTRFGIGSTLLGKGDMVTLAIENELNYKLNNYFATSGSIMLGKSITGVGYSASFIQGGVGIHFSPLKNNRKNDFRVGVGTNYISASYTSKATLNIKENSQVVDYQIAENANKYGWGLRYMLENTYQLSDKYMIGIKLYSDIFPNVDINTGALLKIGIQL